MQQIIFLDIDGVLTSGSTLLLEHNQWIMRKASEIESTGDKQQYIASQIRFDTGAVALLNRLCDISGAKIVITSGWRWRISPKTIVNTLIASGVDTVHLHESPVCKIRGIDAQKIHDILNWLDSHGYADESYESSTKPYECPFIILDDEKSQFNDKCVAPHPDTGLTLTEYRISLALLGHEDKAHGVIKLTDDEFALVKGRFPTNEAAIHWLYNVRSNDRPYPPAWFLSEEAANDCREHGILGLQIASYKNFYPTRRDATLSLLEPYSHR